MAEEVISTFGKVDDSLPPTPRLRASVVLEEVHGFEGDVFDDEGRFHPRAAGEDADAPPSYEFLYAIAQEVHDKRTEFLVYASGETEADELLGCTFRPSARL
ncbi:hypothetical protein LTR42_008650 [Elasticomyces elasticus]|nr:hypothetical protein LTR42_008650 [Elasticomyces elasticus]